MNHVRPPRTSENTTSRHPTCVIVVRLNSIEATWRDPPIPQDVCARTSPTSNNSKSTATTNDLSHGCDGPRHGLHPRGGYPATSTPASLSPAPLPPHSCLAEARRALFILAEASMPPVRLQTFTERRSRARPRITRRPPWDPLRGPRQCCWRSEHSSPGLKNGARASRTRR